MRRFVLFFFFFLCLLFSWTTASAQGGKTTPELQKRLQTFLPDDEVSVIVTLNDKVDLKLFRDRDRRLRRSKLIRSLKEKADLTQRPLRAFLETRRARKMKSLWLINGMAVTTRAHVIEELATLPEVKSIRLDGVITIPEVALEAGATPEWNISAIRAAELWDLGFTGQGIVVANMDSGVDIDHPDLGGRWRGGANSWFNPYRLPENLGDCAIPFQCTSCESSAIPCDDDGHGTGTMGVMVGGNAGGTAIGVAPGARWIGVKIFNTAGEAPVSVIHQGFQWLLDPDGDPNTDDAPDVVNNSWAFDSVDDCSPQALEFREDIQALKAAGIAVVSSAGNSGPSAFTSVSPANYPESFAVGATDQSNQVAPSSGRGPSACDGSIYPQVVAPGVSIKLADLQLIPSPPAYTHLSGTSFAAPHVAGGMALLLDAFPGLAVSELELALKQSAFDLGAFGPDNDSGYGFLDVKKAYELILNPAPDILAFPPSLEFAIIKEGSFSLPRAVTVINRGAEDLFISNVEITGTDAAEFFKQNDGCSGQTLTPSQTCILQVVFSPFSGGAKNADLSLQSNDPDSNPLNVRVSGTGIEQYLLNVSIGGSGIGKVMSMRPAIDCGSGCQEFFNPAVTAILKAIPGAESAFGGWTGCDSSFGTTCRATMNTDKDVTANFIGPSLSITSPHGGEGWKAGSFKKITWHYTGNPGQYVSIELIKGDALYSTVASRVRKGSNGKGMRYWRIPKDLLPGNDYEIRITSTTNNSYTDTSDSPFTIDLN